MRWLLLPFTVVAAALAGLFARPRRRSPDEVARYIRDFLERTGRDSDWDDFESIPIADPALDSIRRRAVSVGPPDPDIETLRQLLAEAEALAAAHVR